MNRLIALPMNPFLPYIAHVTTVLSPSGLKVKSTVATPSIGRFQSMRSRTSLPGWLSVMVLLPAPMSLLPSQLHTAPTPDSGVGAACSWDGNKDIGAGSATITESKPGELVRERMDWIRPMAGVATVDFTFKPEGDKTVVTWAMYGKNGFMGKLFSVFMDCDKMCGPQFEQGLADLGKIVTAAPAAK